MIYRILIDVDSVVADLVGETLVWLNRKFPNKPLKYEDITDFYFLDTDKFNIINKEQADYIKKLWSGRYWAYHLPVMDGAVQGVEELKKLGDIYFVTSPWAPSHTWAYDRTTWINRFFKVPADNVIFTGHKGLIRGDVLIDDCPKYIKQWAEEGNPEKVIIYDQPWNRKKDLETFKRAHNWKEIVKCIKKMKS